MKIDLSGSGVIALAAVAAVGLVAWYAWSKRGAFAGAAASAADAVNPASDTNLVNRAVSATGAAVTGDSSWTLGGQLAEWFSPSVRAANDSLSAPPPAGKPLPTTGDFARADRADYAAAEASVNPWIYPMIVGLPG